ncbi:MAG: retropepsin-like domain-containing protein, partial [Treponema sp.]|nr:retropepsin-like domain-containing protein [Treponema sp.]
MEKFENKTNLSPSFILLAGKLSYMLGYYDISEYYFKKLIDNIEYHDIVLSNLLLVYYQQNRFDKIKELPFSSENRDALIPLIGAFIDNPYQIQWSNLERTSVIKFITTDILPVFDIKVNGKTIMVLFDTGADMLVLDP